MTTYSHFFWNFVLARRRRGRWPFALGAVLPDLVYFPLMAGAWIEHGPGSWGDLARWDAAAAHPLTLALHSWVPAGLGLAVALLAGWTAAIPWLAGILTHVFIDMLTHVSDAYPILWPLSDVRLRGPISYYEPAHYGREFFVLEHGAMLGTLVVLWLRSARRRRSARDRVPVAQVAE